MDGLGMLPDVDVGGLERVLSEVLEHPVRLTGAAQLGASSRATPWRVDVTSDAGEASFLVRYGESANANEVVALNAMADHPIPTPRMLYWDESGTRLGMPVFVSEFINGKPLLPSMTAGHAWAVDLYLDTVCALQSIHLEDLSLESTDTLVGGGTMQEIIEAAHVRLEDLKPLHDLAPLHQAVYERLIETQPVLPELAFGNGDLWPENMLIEGRRLVGVIDWQHAGWSDPIFEFLLPFFLVAGLRHRGIEERYLRRQGYETSLLHWYHGVEYYESLSYVLETGEPYEIHTAESLTLNLERWLAGT